MRELHHSIGFGGSSRGEMVKNHLLLPEIKLRATKGLTEACSAGDCGSPLDILIHLLFRIVQCIDRNT
jgi:hypothetical protein